MFDVHRLAPLISAFQRIQTTSVLAPLFVPTIIVGVVGLIGSPFLPIVISGGLWILFGLCVLFTLGAYVYWSAKEPNRLQTERYQLEQKRLLLIGDERDPNSMKLIDSAPSANTVGGTP
jgi:hypothetical protein